jgi:hypothetical protein
VFDVRFGENDSRLRAGMGSENRAVLRKAALTAARADTERKSGIIGRRKQMLHEYLERLLFQAKLAPAPV